MGLAPSIARTGRPTRRPGPQPSPPPSLWRQAAVYAVLGTASTLAYLGIYAALRVAVASQIANVLAMAVTTVLNTAANRRYTFDIRGPKKVARQQFRGLVLFVLGLAVSAGALEILHVADPTASRIAELAVLLAASIAMAIVRFQLMRVWVFRSALATQRGS